MSLKTGWLGYSGDFYPCSVWEHQDTAYDLCEKFKYPVPAGPSYVYPDYEDILYKKNWVKISFDSFDHVFLVFWDLRRNLSKAQFDFLEEYVSSGKVNKNFVLAWKAEENNF